MQLLFSNLIYSEQYASSHHSHLQQQLLVSGRATPAVREPHQGHRVDALPSSLSPFSSSGFSPLPTWFHVELLKLMKLQKSPCKTIPLVEAAAPSLRPQPRRRRRTAACVPQTLITERLRASEQHLYLSECTPGR